LSYTVFSATGSHQVASSFQATIPELKHLEAFVVRIRKRTGNDFGTGFRVGTNYIFTARHVIQHLGISGYLFLKHT